MAIRRWIQDLNGSKPYRRYYEREDRRRRLLAQIYSLLAVLASVIYLLWLSTRLNLNMWWLSLPYYVCELAGLAVFGSFAVVCWYPRYHHQEGLPFDELRAVDVFITVCGEPFEIVSETILAATGIEYKQKTIYVLDDKGDARVRKLAQQLGIQYLARPFQSDAKAGNLNYAFTRTHGELILTLDADQVPDPKIISTLVGYFHIPKVGFVQSLQRFYVPKEDPFCNSDPIFYGIMQPGKDTDNAAFSCGSGVIYRRAALEEIGGFSTWNLVEDLHTSMLLHDKGWHSIFHDTPLSIGTAPTDIWSIYKQRQQWAADCLRIFFWDNPYTKTGLSFRQKFQYAHTGFVYLFAGFMMPLFYVLPVVALTTGQCVIVTEFWSYLLYRLPAVVFSMAAYKAFIPISTFYRATNTWLGYFPCYIAGAVQALWFRRRKPTYKVNVKIWDRKSTCSQLLGLSPQLLLIVLSVGAIPYGFIVGTGNFDMLAISSIWALWTIDTLRWVLAAPFRLKTAERYVSEIPKHVR
jgi:cellulose synthase (UDP-forming)